MKKLFIFIFTFVAIFYLFPRLANAIDCDWGTGVGCTWCIDYSDGGGCVVDNAKSNYCTDYGEFPDPSVCASGGQMCQNGVAGECSVAPPTCGHTGDSCTGLPGTIGDCCVGEGNVCDENGFCNAPEQQCKYLTEECLGPNETLSNCCSGQDPALECRYVPFTNVLRCLPLEDSDPTGFFCSGFDCLPCYADSTNPGCNPIQFSDYNSCDMNCPLQNLPTGYYCDESGAQNQCLPCYINSTEPGCVPSPEYPEPNGLINCAPDCHLPGSYTAPDYRYGGPKITIQELIGLIFKIMVPVSIGFGLFFIILAGYTLKTSEGDPIKKKAGMEQLSAAIIGTLFVVLSLTILNIIINTVLGR